MISLLRRPQRGTQTDAAVGSCGCVYAAERAGLLTEVTQRLEWTRAQLHSLLANRKAAAELLQAATSLLLQLTSTAFCQQADADTGAGYQDWPDRQWQSADHDRPPWGPTALPVRQVQESLATEDERERPDEWNGLQEVVYVDSEDEGQRPPSTNRSSHEARPAAEPEQGPEAVAAGAAPTDPAAPPPAAPRSPSPLGPTACVGCGTVVQRQSHEQPRLCGRCAESPQPEILPLFRPQNVPLPSPPPPRHRAQSNPGPRKRYRYRPPLQLPQSESAEPHVYLCDVCGLQFKFKDTLRHHRRRHGCPKSFGCWVCGLRLSSRENLNRHRYKIHKHPPIRGTYKRRRPLTKTSANKPKPVTPSPSTAHTSLPSTSTSTSQTPTTSSQAATPAVDNSKAKQANSPKKQLQDSDGLVTKVGNHKYFYIKKSKSDGHQILVRAPENFAPASGSLPDVQSKQFQITNALSDAVELADSTHTLRGSGTPLTTVATPGSNVPQTQQALLLLSTKKHRGLQYGRFPNFVIKPTQTTPNTGPQTFLIFKPLAEANSGKLGTSKDRGSTVEAPTKDVERIVCGGEVKSEAEAEDRTEGAELSLMERAEDELVAAAAAAERVAAEDPLAEHAAEKKTGGEPKGEPAGEANDDLEPSLQYKCPLCPEAFAGPIHRWRHVRAAHGMRPFRCPQCPQAYRNPCELRVHTRQTHARTPKHACRSPGCGTVFLYASQRLRHERKEHGMFPIECDSCDKVLSSTVSLQTHRRVAHTGERPFVCSVCGRTYANEHRCRQHMTNHHGCVLPPRPRGRPPSPDPFAQPNGPASDSDTTPDEPFPEQPAEPEVIVTDAAEAEAAVVAAAEAAALAATAAETVVFISTLDHDYDYEAAMLETKSPAQN